MKLLIPVFVYILITQFDCEERNTLPETQVFVIKVDSISHPLSISYRDTLRIKLYGTVGNDGCSSFLGLDETKQPYNVYLTIRGKRKLSGACPAVMVYLDGMEYKTITNVIGWYKIYINQPDGSVLKDSVFLVNGAPNQSLKLTL